jgi:threonine dehydratase
MRLRTQVIGVVSTEAQTAKLSVEAGHPVATCSARTFADGMAVRVPVDEALAVYGPGAERIIAVDDAAIAEAVRAYLTDTHNLAEGAGAAALAGLLAERDLMRGKRVGLILSGGNIDAAWLAEILAGRVPKT